jgi:hypothetical protein
MPIILITGGFMGLWTALKHSPTIRTRRFMCRTALQWFVFIWAFQLIKLYTDQGYGGWDTHGGAFFACYFAIIIGFCAWLVYRWRLLLEEDAGLRPTSDKLLEKTSLSLFWLRCWYWIPLLPVMFFSAGMSCDLYNEFYRETERASSSLVSVGLPLAGSLLFLSIPIGFFLVVGYGIRTSRDDNSLRRWYPREGKAFLPKPEERTHWTAFWFDLIVMCFIAVIPIIPLVIFPQMMVFNGITGWVLVSTMLMTVTALIASHSAGIPGKRLRGYAKLCLFLGLCYMILPRGVQIYFVVYFVVALLAFVLSRRHRR